MGNTNDAADAASEPNAGQNDGTTAPEAKFEPINTQDEFNARLSHRLERERAKFSDYDDLKAKAAQLDAIEEANKSELEKANERADQAERDRDQQRVESLRWRVAAKHGITDADADLFLTGTDEETLTRQAERLAARETAGSIAPNVGGQITNTQTGDWLRDQFSRT